MMESAKVQASLVDRILVLLQQPIFFRDVLAALGDSSYRQTLLAWSDVRTHHALLRDEQGRYVLERKA